MELFRGRETGPQGEVVKSVRVGAELMRLGELADLGGDFSGIGFMD
jgi:hypothetical protein